MVILKEPFSSIPQDEFQALVDESLSTGFNALERLQKEQADGSNTFDRPGEAMFTARVDGRVIGLCALNYDPFGTDPSVARLRRMYVALAHRRKGIASELVRAAIAEARKNFKTLQLRSSEEAIPLYEGLGFLKQPGEVNFTHALAL